MLRQCKIISDVAPEFTLANAIKRRIQLSDYFKKRTCSFDMVPWRMVSLLQHDFAVLAGTAQYSFRGSLLALTPELPDNIHY
jgi:hypothetical protein